MRSPGCAYGSLQQQQYLAIDPVTKLWSVKECLRSAEVQ